MEVEPFENPWMKKNRLLTKLLLVSVAVNIGLATTVFYMTIEVGKEEERPKQVVLQQSNGEVLAAYFKSTFQDLVKELKDKTFLQDGYTKRDLALACLVNYHYLNLEKAISGKPLQRRKLTFVHQGGGESFQVEVFPQLDDLDFSMVEKFIKEEKWPFSAEGLFVDLKKQGKERDKSLETAFFATPEFCVLHTSLKRFDGALTKEKILDLMLEGSFDRIESWLLKCKRGGDFLEGMRELFQEYIREGSCEAAHLWIALDNEYIQRHLTDLELHRLMQLVKENVLSVNIFLKQILCSVRSDEMRKEAAMKLYEFIGVHPKDPYDHEEALKTFLPSMFAKKESPKILPVISTPIVKKHIVVEGDSLWRISRKYKVTIEALREHNHLKSDNLKPGQELILPYDRTNDSEVR